MIIDRNGLLLTQRVDLKFLEGLEPQFFKQENYIKFVVDENTNAVVVGMEIHRDCLDILASVRDYELNFNEAGVYGGNLYYDGRIKWTSSLNNAKNIKLREWGENPREIVNKELIERLTEILRLKIDF